MQADIEQDSSLAWSGMTRDASDEDTATCDARAGRRLPWFVYLFLLVVFGVASFDLFLSEDYVARRDKTVDERLEESVERTEAGNPARRIALVGLGVVAAVSLTRRRHRLGVNGALGVLTVLFVAWCALSILWSHDQMLTFRRVALLMMLCLGALAAAERLSFREITWFVFLTGCVTIAGGLACELALGTFMPQDPEYRFAGMMNPIFQGAHCGTTIVAALALAHADRTKTRKVFYAVAIVAFILMLLTRSRGPAGATVVAVAVYLCCVYPAFRKIALFSVVPVLALLVASGGEGGLFQRVEDTLLFGRQIDRAYEMQGRDLLWHECLRFASMKPLLGYGYDAFWTRDFTFAVTDASGFTSQHTHNAVLDVLLGTGIPGAAAYVLVVLIALRNMLRTYRKSHSVYHACALSLLTLYVLHNLLVSVHLSAQLQTFVVLTIIAKLCLVRDSVPERVNMELDRSNET